MENGFVHYIMLFMKDFVTPLVGVLIIVLLLWAWIKSRDET